METVLERKIEEDLKKYHLIRNETKLLIKEGKEQSWADFQIERKLFRKPKLFYSTLNRLKQKRHKTTKHKDKEGNILTEETEIMERWRQHFEERKYTRRNELGRTLTEWSRER